ncbi:MAG: ribose-phosphate pyrophosphokinase [Clostridium sp.]
MNSNDINSAYGDLGLIVLNSSKEFGEKVNNSLREIKSGEGENNTYIVNINETRFSNGEGKVVIEETVRGKDLYILCDVGNHSCTYELFGYKNHMGPDEHFQDIKRVLSAIGGRARRITVIMPLLYASRQHRRKRRESLDCALALQELERLGVEEIITFDVHDPNIQNAIPMISFTNLYPTFEILKSFIKKENKFPIDKSEMLVISPDTGAMDRAIYYSSVLGLDVGLFYKRRDHSITVKGKNPIVQHEYIGREVDGKNILIVDDMIASGESVFDIVDELSKRNVGKVFVATTFAFFTEGTEKFKRYYEEGKISQVFSTNLTHISEEVKNAPWFTAVDMSAYLASIVEHLNYDKSIHPLIDAKKAIKDLNKLAQK